MTKILAGPVLKAREEKKPRFAIAVFHNLLEKRTNSFARYILAGKKNNSEKGKKRNVEFDEKGIHQPRHSGACDESHMVPTHFDTFSSEVHNNWGWMVRPAVSEEAAAFRVTRIFVDQLI